VKAKKKIVELEIAYIFSENISQNKPICLPCGKYLMITKNGSGIDMYCSWCGSLRNITRDSTGYFWAEINTDDNDTD
jgi:hypothetical protein